MAIRGQQTRQRQYVAGRPVPDEAPLEDSLRPQPERGEGLLHDSLGEEVEVAERILERDGSELAEGRFGGPEVALLDRAGEASVCRPLTRHRQCGARRGRV